MSASECIGCHKRRGCMYSCAKNNYECLIRRAHNIQLAKAWIDIDSLLKIKNDITCWPEEIDKSINELVSVIGEISELMNIYTGDNGVMDIIKPLADNLDVNHTIEYLSLDLTSSDDIKNLNEIIDLCNRGYEWGMRGYWQDGDYSSDADWVYGPGANIQKLEDKLEIDDGWVFDQFLNAHSLGLVAGGFIE